MSRPSTSNTSGKDAFVGRRSFLKSSVAVGLGAPFLSVGDRTIASGVAAGCGYKLSAVEALQMFSDLALRIQSDSFNILNRRILTVAIDCQNQFHSLCESVGQLEVELRRTRPTSSDSQVQQMRVLAEIGCATASQLVNTTLPQNPAALAQSLETINRQIALAAEQLLPNGETVLTAEATRLLRLILTQVHQSAAIQRNINTARTSMQEERDLIVNGVQLIQRLIFDASSKILIADDETSRGSQKARQDAVKLLGDAQTKVKEFIAKLEARDLYAESPAAEVLLIVLEGTKQWVSEPASVGATNASYRASDQVRFLTISDVEPRAALPVLGLDPREVTRLLRYCPPDGVIHLGQVLTAMTALIGYKNAQRPLIFLGQRGPVTFEEVLGWVKSVLNAMRMSCRPEGNTVPDRDSLAQGLANLIFG